MDRMNSSVLEAVDARTKLAGSNRMEILLFSLGTQDIFGINVFKVREVSQTPKITKTPNMPVGVEGVISLRGNIIPVISLDANPTYGNLGRLVDPSATATLREFMSDDQVTTYPMARSYTGKNRQGLEVLPGNQNVANPMVLTDELFNAVIARARQFYQLALIDCGPHIEHRVMRSVLSQADALVIVGTMGFDGAAAAETTLDWLDARNSHELLRRSVVVLNDVHDNAESEFLGTVEKSLAPRVGAVKTIPFDKHLRDSHTLDFTALQKKTRLAFIDLAAWLAKGFTGNVGAR